MAHSHYPSARSLSRQELYSYGFKEGQPWGEDKRALESALNAMDKLERDIQENYIYDGTASSYNAYSPSAATPRHCVSRSTFGNTFSAARYPTPDFRIARSDASDYSPQMSQASPYSDRGYEYRDSHENYLASRWQQSHSVRDSGSHSSSSPGDYATSFSSRQNYDNAQQYHAPTSRVAHSRSRTYQHPSDYFSRTPSAAHSAHGSSNPSLQTYARNLSQMQMVPHDGENRQASALQDDSDDQRSYASAEELERNDWSMEATLGTEQVMSHSSSQGIYSEDSALSGYSEVTRSSGCVESYDVVSYEGYREHPDQDSEDEHDYMSDDVASNEGEYYSSGDEPEYGDDGDDVYSDEGSDSYDDGYDYSD